MQLSEQTGDGLLLSVPDASLFCIQAIVGHSTARSEIYHVWSTASDNWFSNTDNGVQYPLAANNCMENTRPEQGSMIPTLVHPLEIPIISKPLNIRVGHVAIFCLHSVFRRP